MNLLKSLLTFAVIFTLYFALANHCLADNRIKDEHAQIEERLAAKRELRKSFNNLLDPNKMLLVLPRYGEDPDGGEYFIPIAVGKKRAVEAITSLHLKILLAKGEKYDEKKFARVLKDARSASESVKSDLRKRIAKLDMEIQRLQKRNLALAEQLQSSDVDKEADNVSEARATAEYLTVPHWNWQLQTGEEIHYGITCAWMSTEINREIGRDRRSAANPEEFAVQMQHINNCVANQPSRNGILTIDTYRQSPAGTEKIDSQSSQP